MLGIHRKHRPRPFASEDAVSPTHLNVSLPRACCRGSEDLLPLAATDLLRSFRVEACMYTDRLPLHRQNQILARPGMTLHRSTEADSICTAAFHRGPVAAH